MGNQKETTVDDGEALIAALRLLLAEVSDSRKMALFLEAFPRRYIAASIGTEAARTLDIRTSAYTLTRLAKNLDGSSPLGAHGQMEIADALKYAAKKLESLATQLRI